MRPTCQQENHTPMLSLGELGFTSESALEAYNTGYLGHNSVHQPIEKICECENACMQCTEVNGRMNWEMCYTKDGGCGGDRRALFAIQPFKCSSYIREDHEYRAVSLKILGHTSESLLEEFDDDFKEKVERSNEKPLGKVCVCTRCVIGSSENAEIGAIYCDRCRGDIRPLVYFHIPFCELCERRPIPDRSFYKKMIKTDTGLICDRQYIGFSGCEDAEKELATVRALATKPAKRD